MTNSVGKEEKLVGVNFTLAAMSDDFIDIILGTLSQVDLTNVWRETDDVSTTIRGKRVHVFDATRAICLLAAKTGKHIGFQATYTTGCPGNVETNAYLEVSDEPKNLAVEAEGQYAAAKFALYPIGAENFMEVILTQIEAMKEHVEVSRVPLATKLSGNLSDIFTGLENSFQAMLDAGSHHNVMTVTISINSPSHQ